MTILLAGNTTQRELATLSSQAANALCRLPAVDGAASVRTPTPEGAKVVAAAMAHESTRPAP